MTPIDVELIAPAAALAGVALATVSNAYLDRSRERRAAKSARDQAITELLTATLDLITGVQAVRGAYGSQTRWRHYIRVAALVLVAVGATMTVGEKISSELLEWRRASPVLERFLTEDRSLDDVQRRTALDVATVVGPRTSRFYAAVTVLTLGPDKEIANAVRDVAGAVGDLLEVLGDKEKKYARTRDRVADTLAEFRVVVDRRHH